jgi:hypothetical protein
MLVEKSSSEREERDSRGDPISSLSSERGTVTVVEYVALAAVFLAFTGAITGVFAAQVENSKESVTKVEMDRVSAEIAAGIEDVESVTNERAVTGFSGTTPKASVQIETPEQTGTEPYVIRIDNDDQNVIVENTVGSRRLNSTASFDTANDVETVGTISGGTEITITHERGSDISIEVGGV